MSNNYVFQNYAYDYKWRIIKGKIVKKEDNQFGRRGIKGKIIKTNDDNIIRRCTSTYSIYDNGSLIDKIYDTLEELIQNHFSELLC